MKIFFLSLLACFSAFAQSQERGSYIHPTYTAGRDYNRLGADAQVGLGSSLGIVGKFFRAATERPADDLVTWEGRAGANFLTSQGHLFQFLGVYRDEPNKVKARGFAPSVRVPIHSLWEGDKSTIAGLDVEWIKHTGMAANNPGAPDEMTQYLFGPSVKQELVKEVLFVTVGHEQYFYDEDSLAARRKLNNRFQTFSNSGAILVGLPDNTTYTRLDAILGEWITLSPRLSTSKSLELDNRTFVAAVGTWVRLPFISVGLDLGVQTAKNNDKSQHFVGVTFAL